MSISEALWSRSDDFKSWMSSAMNRSFTRDIWFVLTASDTSGVHERSCSNRYAPIYTWGGPSWLLYQSCTYIVTPLHCGTIALSLQQRKLFCRYTKCIIRCCCEPFGRLKWHPAWLQLYVNDSMSLLLQALPHKSTFFGVYQCLKWIIWSKKDLRKHKVVICWFQYNIIANPHVRFKMSRRYGTLLLESVADHISESVLPDNSFIDSIKVKVTPWCAWTGTEGRQRHSSNPFTTPQSGHFTPREDPVLIVQEAGWASWGQSGQHRKSGTPPLFDLGLSSLQQVTVPSNAILTAL